MSEYRVTLSATTTTGRWLTTEQIEISDADEVEQALDRARWEFFGRTALVSGVWLVTERVERRRGEIYFPLIRAAQVAIGTWVRVQGQWRRVARWEPVGDGVCRLFTGTPGGPYARNEGVYGRDDVFETR